MRQLLQKLLKVKETVLVELLNAREFGLPRYGFQFKSAVPVSDVMTMLFNSVSVFLAFTWG